MYSRIRPLAAAVPHRYHVPVSAWLLALLLAACPWSEGAPARATVTVLAVSDYHSHALPFYSEGRPAQAGIARAIEIGRASCRERV